MTTPPRVPLRVGIIGCGNVALNFHVPAYQAVPAHFTVAALADPTPERLELGRTTAGLAAERVYTDALDLIARDDIDVVDVCTPQHLHRDIVVAAARAGKHILCEKPLAATPADAQAMVEAADDADVVLGVVHNYLFFPEVVAARRLIDSGALGDVRTVVVDMLGVVDSPGATGYQPRWRHDPAAAGGGVLMDMLHGVYLAEHLLAEPVERVSGYVDAATPGDAVEGLALCRLETAHRAGMVNIGWGLGPGGIRITGSKGRLILRYHDEGTMPWAPFESMTMTTESGTETVDLPSGQELAPLIATALRDTVVDLADAILGRRSPAAPGSAALRTLESTVGVYQSAAQGTTVALPLDPASPTHRRGVIGLNDLDIPATSPVRQRHLFGLTSQGA
ncbi:Gfo/Idh/MocA family protein [Gordonia rhizosphera]|uniref:Putative oxidoreductase n=1 Tax=Gordonia rhizosphera NBRC 16068 TaxID=1108045 RepID=K6WWD6_9ACTN|nr:Gfo/Idh/MocA family oxidoreductase [Gordonia rhizosphera]GAB90844.1 putative oxidoreductase [Gordonia rhizosphera NBRC 16068]